MREFNPLSDESVTSGDMLPSPNDGWHPDNLSFALASEPRERPNRMYREGHQYPLGDPEEPQADLYVYPRAHVVHYTSPEHEITMHKVLEPSFVPTGVIFESRGGDYHATLMVNDAGEATFVSSRYKSDDHREQSQDKGQPITIEHRLSTNTKQESKEDVRVNLVGRVGREPRLYETSQGVPISKFPLVEYITTEEGEQRVSHTVVAFRDRAKEVAETVRRNDPVRVIGYRHEYENLEGERVKEIYAAFVRKSSKNPKPIAE